MSRPAADIHALALAAPADRDRPISLALHTWRVIGRRWFFPILLVGGPIIWAQRQLVPDDVDVVARAAGMIAASLMVAPLSWRLLFPLELRPSRAPLRLLTYAALGFLTIWAVAIAPAGLEGTRYLVTSADPGLFFALGLFWVAGFALGRAVQLEESLFAERRRAASLARAAEQAELMASRSHLDPHFLFNTLGAIAEWCREDPEVAERALLQLSNMLRGVLAGVRADTWPLERELDMVASLFDLYRARDPERFVLARRGWELAGEARIPPMLLLSLVENAIKHGPAAGARGPVEVAVEADCEGLRLTVRNPGRFGGPRAGGRGLELVRRRLALAYGEAARFQIGEETGEETGTDPGARPGEAHTAAALWLPPQPEVACGG